MMMPLRWFGDTFDATRCGTHLTHAHGEQLSWARQCLLAPGHEGRHHYESHKAVVKRKRRAFARMLAEIMS